MLRPPPPPPPPSPLSLAPPPFYFSVARARAHTYTLTLTKHHDNKKIMSSAAAKILFEKEHITADLEIRWKWWTVSDGEGGGGSLIPGLNGEARETARCPCCFLSVESALVCDWVPEAKQTDKTISNSYLDRGGTGDDFSVVKTRAEWVNTSEVSK